MDPAASLSPSLERTSITYEQSSYDPITETALKALKTVQDFVVQTFSDCFIDGNRAWKYKKYEIALQSIVSSFDQRNENILIYQDNFSYFPESDAKESVLKMISLLKFQERSEDLNLRIRYRSFVDELRKALLSPKNLNEYLIFLEKICFYRYTENDFKKFLSELILNIIHKGIEVFHQNDQNTIDLLKRKNLSHHTLKSQLEYIQYAPQQEKAPHLDLLIELGRGGLNIGFDSQRRGNIPYKLFDFMINQKIVHVLRMSTPTMQRTSYESATFDGEALIVPEFETFINYLNRRKQTLLLISLQDRTPRFAGTENTRNEALIHLHKKYEKSFQLVIFAHDSDFYYQTAKFENISDAEIFKSQFLDQMMSSDGGFFFPKDLQLFKTFRIIMDEVHFDLYLQKEHLSKEERMVFIEIFYARITLLLIKLTNTNYLVNVCKDSIDRAAIKNSIIQYLLLIFFHKENSIPHLDLLYTYLHGGAFIVKKRCVNSRIDRLMNVLNHLENEEIKNRLRYRIASIGVQGEDFISENILGSTI